MTDDQAPTEPGHTGEASDGPTPDSPLGDSFEIGPYVLRQKIGEGGMGEVWLAEQAAPLRRRVALKIIKRGMDSRQVIARFEAERQALALMDHPGIAKVFDAGETDTGRPYFVMEYVQGLPITTYCDNHRLGAKQRLELFIRVCEGVQHAHHKAVIHRDLKPSNILVAEVDGRPQPKIIDFGVAKATVQRLTEQTMFTEFGQLIGTPEYMSPEQAEISIEDIDTRSDVYSLGVILYELLIGTLPFTSQQLREAGFDGIRHMIREVDPPTPSTRLTKLRGLPDVASHRDTTPGQLRRTLRGELDWIVMKALEKDRNRRYETANGFAADIRRHLADEPVAAGPPDALYRLKKLMRRHKAATFAVVSVLLMLVVTVAGTSWGMIRARRAEQRAAHEASISRAVNEFLNQDLLASVAPSARKGRGRDVLMREVLDAAAERIESASTPGGRFSEQPLVEAAIRSTLGTTYQYLGEYEAAEPHLVRALEIREKIQGPVPEVAASLRDLGFLYRRQGLFDRAEELLRRSTEILTHTVGPDHSRTVASIADLGRVVEEQGRSAEAESLFVRALEIQRRTLGEEDDETLRTMAALASFYQQMARFDEAEALHRETLDIYRRTLGENDVLTVSSMNNLANVYASQSRFDEAIPLWTRSLELKRKIFGDEHPSTLNTLNNLAEAQEIIGRYAEAETLHHQVLEARGRVLGTEHPETLRSRARLAFVVGMQGRGDEAQTMATEAVTALTRSLGADHPRTIEAEDVLGTVLLERGKSAEAAELFARLRATLQREHPDDEFSLTLVGAHLGCALIEQGRREQAQEVLMEVVPDLPAVDAEAARVYRALVGMYEQWNAEEPGQGFDDQAQQWREKLDEVTRALSRSR